MREGAPPRKRRPWLLLPAVGLAVFLAACSCGWLYARWRIDAALDARMVHLRAAGWRAALPARRWSGFPFRLRIDATGAQLVTPEGWGVEAPRLAAEALIFDPSHWVFSAPGGLTLNRGAAGAVTVTGGSLSASVSNLQGRVWRVAVVGDALTLSSAPGAKPTAFSRMGRWEAYLRPASDGSGDAEALWRLTGGAPTPHGLVWKLAPNAPVQATLTGRFTRLAAFAGADWGARVRAWGAAGGAFSLQEVVAQGGATRAWARGGALSVGPDGRLVGAVPLEVRQGVDLDPAAPAGPSHAPPTIEGGEEGRGSTRLVFEGGQARLGGLRLGPSPKVG